MGFPTKNRCVICGKEYDVCLSCSDVKIRPWKTVCDSLEHYNVLSVLANYNNGNIKVDEAKEKFAEMELDIESFNEEVRDQINSIIEKQHKKK